MPKDFMGDFPLQAEGNQPHTTRGDSRWADHSRPPKAHKGVRANSHPTDPDFAATLDEAIVAGHEMQGGYPGPDYHARSQMDPLEFTRQSNASFEQDGTSNLTSSDYAVPDHGRGMRRNASPRRPRS